MKSHAPRRWVGLAVLPLLLAPWLAGQTSRAVGLRIKDSTVWRGRAWPAGEPRKPGVIDRVVIRSTSAHLRWPTVPATPRRHWFTKQHVFTNWRECRTARLEGDPQPGHLGTAGRAPRKERHAREAPSGPPSAGRAAPESRRGRVGLAAQVESRVHLRRAGPAAVSAHGGFPQGGWTRPGRLTNIQGAPVRFDPGQAFDVAKVCSKVPFVTDHEPERRRGLVK